MPGQKSEISNANRATTVNTLPGLASAPPRLLFFPPMSTSSDDQLMANGQRERAATAHLNPNDPAHEAAAGTPVYGDFGKAEYAANQPSNSGRDGSNDNPDEFSELRKPEDATKAPANPNEQRGHVTQNQAPGAVNAVQDAETDEQRAAWSEDDPRYAGGHAKATWQENNDQEHDKN